MSLGRLTAYFFAISISLLLSFFVSQSNFHHRDDSDLPAYEEFYYCLAVNSIDVCSAIISSSYEYIFYCFFYIFSLVGFDFSTFIFFISFVIYSSLLVMVVRMSSGAYGLYIVSLLFLLADFRFYDYGFNIIRHGFASVLMVFATMIFLSYSTKIKYVFLSIPIFAHLSAVAQLSLAIQSKFLHSRALWLLFFLVLFVLAQFLVSIISFIFNIDYIGDKISYYVSGERDQAWLPFQYLAVLLLSLLLDIDDSTYLVVRKVFFALIAMSIFFITTGMSYRFVAFSMPFAAVLLTYHFSYIIGLFTKNDRAFVFSGLLMGVVFYAVLYFHKYNEFIFGGFK